MSTKLSFREALELREKTEGAPRDRSGSPVRLSLTLRDVKQPVSFALLLKKHGMSLRKAHETLNRLANGETVAVELWADNVDTLIFDIGQFGVKPYLIVPPQIDPKQVRERLGLSQAEFALRFGLELDTVQNWEQGRYRPDPAARLLLGIIDRDPKLVDSVLTTPAATDV